MVLLSLYNFFTSAIKTNCIGSLEYNAHLGTCLSPKGNSFRAIYIFAGNTASKKRFIPVLTN